MLPWIRPHLNKTVATILLAVTVFVFLVMVFPLPVGAQALPVSVQTNNDTFGLQQVNDTVALASADIRIIIARIIRVVLGLLGAIAVSIILYAGFTIMTSGGNEDKVTAGKKILINAVIGLAIILASFGIVQFVLNQLQNAINPSTNFNEETGGGKIAFNTFGGTGALGDIVRDHYPTFKQTGVVRNTKIAVTFSEAIDPASVVQNTNGTCWGPGDVPTAAAAICGASGAVPYYGDCTDINADGTIDWATECDRLVTSSVKIYKTENKAVSPIPVYEAAALTTYDSAKRATTFVFRPLENLGDSTKNVWHKVDLLGSIKKADGGGAFDKLFYKHYAWEFETNTTIDFAPPWVSGTSPYSGQYIARNKVLQINFSEAVDPTVAQGVLNGKGGFTNIIFNTTTITGQWKITNGYRTAEFVSDQACGQNTCGNTMYCLPVPNCAAGDTTCAAPATILVRTAGLLNPAENNFVAKPFDGLMDMAGNALDNGLNNIPDNKIEVPAGGAWRHKPPVGSNPQLMTFSEKSPDNFWVDFRIKNVIDRTAPYIRQVTPGIDQEGVDKAAAVDIWFSKNMWLASLAEGVKIDEYPANIKGADGQPLDKLGYNSFGSQKEDGTLLRVLHTRDFGPNGIDLYYFTSVSSSVMSDNQNCVYPGRGPISATKNAGPSPLCTVTYNEAGDMVSAANCAAVDMTATQDTGCVTTNGIVNTVQPNLATCLNLLKTPAISPQTNSGN